MLGQQKGDFFFLVEVFDDFENLLHDLRRQAHGRLVQQDHVGAGHQRTADGAHLLLAARGIGCLRCAAGFQARKIVVNLLKVGCDFSLVFAGVAAGQQVFLNGQVRKTVPPFHDLHHASLHQVGGGEVFNAFASQLNRALGNRTTLALQQIGDGAQGGGFTRAVAPQNSHNFAIGHLQGNTLEHQNHMVVDDLNAIDIEHNF